MVSKELDKDFQKKEKVRNEKRKKAPVGVVHQWQSNPDVLQNE
jgi:hypothetical protein